MINYKGKVVYSIFEFPIEDKTKILHIHRLKSKKTEIQGLKIKVIKGLLDVNDVKATEVVLWADTSPDMVDIIIRSKDGCRVKIWNIWKTDDLQSAWIGNAGMLVETKGPTILLSCSDGIGEINFTDLVVRIESSN